MKNEYDKDIEEFPDTRYTDLVTQLEGQYALKVLKPEYRISLTTIAQKMELEGRRWRVKTNEKDEDLKIFYKDILKQWGIKESIIADLYFKFLTSLPIRSQLSILKVYISSETEAQDRITNITDVFYSDLKMMNIEVGDLVGGYGFTNIHILRFLIENKILDEGSQLIPKTNNPSINASLVALGVVLSGRIQLQPFEIFDHMIRVSNVVAKADQWTLTEAVNKPNIHDFVAHSRCYYDYGLKKIASLQCAYKASFTEVDLLSEGLIPIYGLRKLAKGKVKANTFRLDDLFKLENKESIKDFLGYIPLTGAKDRLGRNQLVYSMFNILGAIGDLLFLNEDESILDEFIRQSQFREYPKFKNHNSLSDEDEIDEPGSDESVNTNPSLFGAEIQRQTSDFIKSFKDWKGKDKRLNIPPYLIGRIMVRTVYSVFT